MKDYSFHLRSAEELLAENRSQAYYINLLAPVMRIAIASSRSSSKCNVIAGQHAWDVGGVGCWISGTTQATFPYSGSAQLAIVVTLHLEIVEPLLRDDLTTSERLAQQIEIATVVSRAY